MTIPSISVVIPTYNSSLVLTEAIASVRAQNWENLELIVVDDGSSDQTPQVLDSLEADDLRCIRQENAGPAAARNVGIAAARGDWIAFLDADDLWLPGKLRTQFTEILQRPNAGFSFTDARISYSSGEEQELECDTGDSPLPYRLLKGNVLATPAVVVRRECLQESERFDTSLRTGEDWDLWLRLAVRFEAVPVPSPLVLIRRSSKQQRASLEMLERCTFRVLDRLFSCDEIARRWPELAALQAKVYAWHAAVLAKSYLRNGRVSDFCRMGIRAVRSHPAGMKHLACRSRVDFGAAM